MPAAARVPLGYAPPHLSSRFGPFWKARFFTDDWIDHDEPNPGAAEFARAVHGRGALVYYLTGRPTIKVDYLAALNERAKSAPEEERAWPLYRQALSQIFVNQNIPEWMNEDLSPSSAKWPEAVAWSSVNRS